MASQVSAFFVHRNPDSTSGCSEDDSDDLGGRLDGHFRETATGYSQRLPDSERSLPQGQDTSSA